MTSWEVEFPKGAGNPQAGTNVGSHNGATNASVASLAAAFNAVPYTRTRAQTVGTLQAIQEDGVPVWEATHSAVGHRHFVVYPQTMDLPHLSE